jgi:hypothetical protein
MLRVLTGMGLIVAALIASAPQSFADPRPFCLSGNRSNGGMPDCTYHTWEQCRASIGGGSDGCYENPMLLWKAREQGRVKQPPRRHTRERY